MLKRHALCCTGLTALVLLGSGCGSGGSQSREVREMFPIVKDGKWGFMDRSGKVVIAPQYEKRTEFREGLAPVQFAPKQWGYIDKSGKIVINPQFEYCGTFKNGYGVAKLPAKWVWVDKTGKILDLNVNSSFGWSEDLAIFTIGPKYGYINASGKIVINPQFKLSSDFREGLAAAQQDNQLYGYIDKKGTWVIQPQYDYAFNFEDGIACVRTKAQGAPDWTSLSGYIDRSGKFVVAPKFFDARPFAEGLAYARPAQVPGGGTSFSGAPLPSPDNRGGGYIDKTGNFVIQPRPELGQAYDFSEGLAQVQTQGGFGYIDKTGKIVIPPQFSGAEPFSGGLAEVSLHGENVLGNDLHGYIDKDGHYVWNPSK